MDLIEIGLSLRDRLRGRRRVFYNEGGTIKAIYELPPTRSPKRDSVLVFSLPKAGSVLLEKCMIDLSAAVGLTYVSIMVHFFKLGLSGATAPPSTARIFLARGYCYGGFREIPIGFEIPIVSVARKILLIRDPRDMLTSHYFSMRDSHRLPGKALKQTGTREVDAFQIARSLDIDAYVEQITPAYKTWIDRYKRMCFQYNVKIYRYEEVIYNKYQWIDDICQYYDWDVPIEIKQQIVAKNEAIPSSEETTKHIRQVHPGDHRRKLKKDTIRRLTDYFEEDMRFFGYTDAAIGGWDVNGMDLQTDQIARL